MTKHLLLEGFMIRPLAVAADLDAASVEQVSLGEQRVTLDELAAFATMQWPMMWASLVEQFNAQVAAEAQAAAEANGSKPRAQRRQEAKAKPVLSAAADVG